MKNMSITFLLAGGGGRAFSFHGKPGPYQPEPIAEGLVVGRNGMGVERHCNAEWAIHYLTNKKRNVL